MWGKPVLSGWEVALRWEFAVWEAWAGKNNCLLEPATCPSLIWHMPYTVTELADMMQPQHVLSPGLCQRAWSWEAGATTRKACGGHRISSGRRSQQSGASWSRGLGVQAPPEANSFNTTGKSSSYCWNYHIVSHTLTHMHTQTQADTKACLHIVCTFIITLS